MDRRRDRRWPRQLEVHFWKRGDEGRPTRAISINVSRTGIFVRTQQVLPSGSRVRLEVFHGSRSFIAEGVVKRALKTPTNLQSVMPSGMGIRFLRIEEMLEDLLPGVDLHAEERIPEGVSQPATGSGSYSGVYGSSSHDKPAPKAPSPSPAPATRPASPPVATPPRGVPAPAPPQGPKITGSLFPLRFRNRDQYRRAYERDISTGGIFISTPKPPPLDSVIEVEVTVDGLAVQPVRLQARVVHRMEPTPGEPDNLLTGIGVQFLDERRAVELLRSLL
jgi:hypothetical protein